MSDDVEPHSRPGANASAATRALERKLLEADGKSGIAWLDRALSSTRAPVKRQRPYRVLAPIGFVALALVLLALVLSRGLGPHGLGPVRAAQPDPKAVTPPGG